jgi:hypothetical protein
LPRPFLLGRATFAPRAGRDSRDTARLSCRCAARPARCRRKRIPPWVVTPRPCPAHSRTRARRDASAWKTGASRRTSPCDRRAPGLSRAVPICQRGRTRPRSRGCTCRPHQQTGGRSRTRRDPESCRGGRKPSQSPAYMCRACPICAKWDAHWLCLAEPLALARTGKRIAARMPMTAIVMRISVRVKPCRFMTGLLSDRIRGLDFTIAPLSSVAKGPNRGNLGKPQARLASTTDGACKAPPSPCATGWPGGRLDALTGSSDPWGPMAAWWKIREGMRPGPDRRGLCR